MALLSMKIEIYSLCSQQHPLKKTPITSLIKKPTRGSIREMVFVFVFRAESVMCYAEIQLKFPDAAARVFTFQ